MKSLFSILISLVFCNAFAQLDSICYQPSSFFKARYEQYRKTPIFIAFSDITNFTTSSIFFDQDKKDIRLAQQSLEEQNYSVETDGVFKNNKGIIFFGEINFNKQYQKDVKWNLSYADVQENGIMQDPNYYGVSKGSKWANQLYKVVGGFSLPITSKWNLVLSTDYKLKQKFRYQFDPRPSIKQNDLKLLGGTSVSFLKNHNIGFSYTYGFSNVLNRISYSDYSGNIPSYKEKYARWIFGYGTFFIPSSLDTKRFLQNNEITVAYLFKNEKWEWSNYFKKGFHESKIYKNNNIDETDKNVNAVFSKDQYVLQSNFLLKLTGSKILTFQCSVKTNDALNYLVNQDGNNYTVSQNQFSFKSSLCSFLNRRSNYDIGVYSEYDHSNQNDRLANEFLNSKSILLGVFGEKQIAISDKWSLLSFFKMAYKKPFQVSMKDGNKQYLETIDKLDFLGQTLKLYYDEVVYNDYNFLKQNKFLIDTKFCFMYYQTTSIQKYFSLFQNYTIIDNRLNAVRGASITFKY